MNGERQRTKFLYVDSFLYSLNGVRYGY